MTSVPSLADLPTLTSITLLLRHHKSSVLLSVEPDTPFTIISALLLSALQSRGITYVPSAAESGLTPLPSSPDEIELAVLTDKRDPAKGWTAVPVRQKELDAKAAGVAGNGKKRAAAAATGAAGKKNGAEAAAADCCPESIGLGDSGWVAWRLRSKDVKANADARKKEQEEGGSEDDDYDDDDDDDEAEDKADDDYDEDMDVDVEMDVVVNEDPGWDVVLPSYEEDEE